MSDPFASALISAVVAGVIGFVAVHYASVRNEDSLRRLAKEQNQTLVTNALTLLQAEVGYDMRLLDDMRTKVSFNLEGTFGEQEFQKRMRFIEEPLPKWLHNTWDSHSLQLAGALSREQISDLTAMYAQLESLNDLHEQLVAKVPFNNFFSTYRESRTNTIPTSPPHAGVANINANVLTFNADTSELWGHCSQIMESLYARGSYLTDLLNPDTYVRRVEDSRRYGTH